MQPTALNLIAIGVFLMTLFSLLGPILQMSPAVPAIATFSLLSLFTLDALTWQGKGATILLEWLAGNQPEQKERIIKHEAGHFLVAYLLEIPITGYTLSAWEAFQQGQPGQAGVRFAPVELTSTLPLITIERYCTVWMAGIAAEILAYGSAQGGAEDQQQLRTALMMLGRRNLDQQERWSVLQAKTLIQENWSAYEALLTAMQQKASVEECYQIIGSTTTKSLN